MLKRYGAVCVSVVVSVIAACGDPESPEVRAPDNVEVAGDPFVEMFDNPDGTSMTLRAGLGDDLALIRADYYERGGRRPVVAAYRTPDGDWGELPVPPVFGDYDLAAVRDTVMIGGFECRDDDCSRLLPRFLVLEEDRRSWREVSSDLGEVRIDPSGEESEAGVALAYPQAMDRAVFSLGFTNYLVDPDTGPVELNYDGDPALINPNWVICRTDDVEILVPFSEQQAGTVGYDEPWRLDGVVLSRDLDDLAAGFQRIATAPQVEVDRSSDVCGYRTLFLYDGATELQFNLDSLDWISRPSNYEDVNSGITVSAGLGVQLSLPDGTTWDAERERSPDGTWSLIPPGTGGLVVTESGFVYAISADGVTTYRRP